MSSLGWLASSAALARRAKSAQNGISLAQLQKVCLPRFVDLRRRRRINLGAGQKVAPRQFRVLLTSKRPMQPAHSVKRPRRLQDLSPFQHPDHVTQVQLVGAVGDFQRLDQGVNRGLAQAAFVTLPAGKLAQVGR